MKVVILPIHHSFYTATGAIFVSIGEKSVDYQNCVCPVYSMLLVHVEQIGE